MRLGDLCCLAGFNRAPESPSNLKRSRSCRTLESCPSLMVETRNHAEDRDIFCRSFLCLLSVGMCSSCVNLPFQVGSLENYYLFEHHDVSRRSVEMSTHHDKLHSDPQVRRTSCVHRRPVLSRAVFNIWPGVCQQALAQLGICCVGEAKMSQNEPEIGRKVEQSERSECKNRGRGRSNRCSNSVVLGARKSENGNTKFVTATGLNDPMT